MFHTFARPMDLASMGTEHGFSSFFLGGGGEGFIPLTLPCCCASPKEVGTGAQAGQGAGADAEAMEGCSLLTCFPWLSQPALL